LYYSTMTSDIPHADAALLTSYLEKGIGPLEDNTRERIVATCELVIASLRTPIETARKHAFLTLDHAAIRTAIGLNLFPLLSTDQESPPRIITTTKLAANTTPPCPPTLLGRLLRYLAQPLCLVLETGPDEWSISPSGRVLACKSFSAGCKLYSDSCGPAFRALPAWVRSQSSSSSSTTRPPTPFKAAMPQVDVDFFDWLRGDAGGLQDFHTWMETLAQHQYDCQQQISFSEWIPQRMSSAETAFIDIGGGSGRQCITLRQKSGQDMHGRIVNQDRSEVVAEVEAKLTSDAIQTMAHDFFTEQPIKGALYI
jgi:hypothetical protein